jgi:hypothetical protein
MYQDFSSFFSAEMASSASDLKAGTQQYLIPVKYNFLFEWGNVSTHGLLFQLASTKNIPIKLVGLVQNGQLVHVIACHYKTDVVQAC